MIHGSVRSGDYDQGWLWGKNFQSSSIKGSFLEPASTEVQRVSFVGYTGVRMAVLVCGTYKTYTLYLRTCMEKSRGISLVHRKTTNMIGILILGDGAQKERPCTFASFKKISILGLPTNHRKPGKSTKDNLLFKFSENSQNALFHMKRDLTTHPQCPLKQRRIVFYFNTAF